MSALRDWRPIRPKPLMPTRTAMALLLRDPGASSRAPRRFGPEWTAAGGVTGVACVGDMVASGGGPRRGLIGTGALRPSGTTPRGREARRRKAERAPPLGGARWLSARVWTQPPILKTLPPQIGQVP